MFPNVWNAMICARIARDGWFIGGTYPSANGTNQKASKSYLVKALVPSISSLHSLRNDLTQWYLCVSILNVHNHCQSIYRGGHRNLSLILCKRSNNIHLGLNTVFWDCLQLQIPPPLSWRSFGTSCLSPPWHNNTMWCLLSINQNILQRSDCAWEKRENIALRSFSICWGHSGE